MATVNYLYRSKKDESYLNLRLLFTHNSNNFQIGGKTKIQVSKDYWENIHHRKRINEPDLSKYRNDLNSDLTELSNFILKHFNEANPNEVDKEWLSDTIERYYNPKPEIPSRLIHFFDWLMELKKNEYSEANKKIMKKIKNKVILFEKYKNKKVLISDVNYSFKYDYLDFATNGVRKPYALTTIEAHFKVIRSVVYEAERQGKEITLKKSDLTIDKDKIKREEIPEIYLNETELEKLKRMEFNDQELTDARDWLLISCYTGQRISDFMRFNSEMIRRNDKGQYFIDFKQLKTQKDATIPFIKEAREIINKRDGEFPPKFTFSKYNELIKEVCRRAKFNKPTKGKIRTFIGKDPKNPKKEDFRDVAGTYPKWQLVSSHIGRRSFATNYYLKKPTHILIQFTKHSTERQFLEYVKKSDMEKAGDAYKYFE